MISENRIEGAVIYRHKKMISVKMISFKMISVKMISWRGNMTSFLAPYIDILAMLSIALQ